MAGHEIDESDIDFVAGLLEKERQHHCKVRAICLGLFVFSFIILVAVLAALAVIMVTGAIEMSGESWLPVLQILAPLCAAMIGFFASWCAVHNCINSIDRSLYAAHAGKSRLFAGFVNELQCASKKKKSMWMDVVGSLIG